MHEHGSNDKVATEGLPSIVLVGNPNVGKSVIFGLLTGHYVTVSNYPGTTVEITRGVGIFNGKKYAVIDTPGVNSLIPMSEDERVTRDVLLKEKVDIVVQVGDSKNLQRTLFLSLQLAEMGVPFILVLNMSDEALKRGISVDVKTISTFLNVPVISTVATERKGINQLFKAMETRKVSLCSLKYDEAIESAVKRIEELLPQSYISRRSLGIMLLSGDTSLKEWVLSRGDSDGKLAQDLEKIVQEVQIKYKEPVGYLISRQRLKEADKAVRRAVTFERTTKSGFADKLGKWATHPLWGIPIVLFVLYLMYEFVGVFGAGVGVDFMESTIFGKYINPAVSYLINYVPSSFIRELFVGEYGLVTMGLTYALAIILPIVTTFFMFFGILEDSGYLPRLAIMSNRIFKIMGLHGKAVLPMVLGLGCDTMATLTARILETKKERLIVTLLLALGVPCSAQLGVILAMLSHLSLKGVILWVGIVVMIIFFVGFLASKLIPGKPSDFVLEIPPIRLPKLSNIVIKTLARIEWYLKEAVPLFILGTILLFLAAKSGILLAIEKLASPVVVHILNLPAKATEAFLIGFLRRDYGAAGLFKMAQNGMLDSTQIVVSLVTITLFVPCIAQFFVMIKERGLKIAFLIAAFIFPFAILMGGILNFLLRLLRITL